MSRERLIYLPLGGAGEIGMNAYVYGYGKPDQERLILVDLGVTFPDMDSTPGVDLILPDIAWLKSLALGKTSPQHWITWSDPLSSTVSTSGHRISRLPSCVTWAGPRRPQPY